MQEVVMSSSKKTKLEPEVTEEGVQELHVVFDRYIHRDVQCWNSIIYYTDTPTLVGVSHQKAFCINGHGNKLYIIQRVDLTEPIYLLDS